MKQLRKKFTFPDNDYFENQTESQPESSKNTQHSLTAQKPDSYTITPNSEQNSLFKPFSSGKGLDLIDISDPPSSTNFSNEKINFSRQSIDFQLSHTNYDNLNRQLFNTGQEIELNENIRKNDPFDLEITQLSLQEQLENTISNFKENQSDLLYLNRSSIQTSDSKNKRFSNKNSSNKHKKPQGIEEEVDQLRIENLSLSKELKLKDEIINELKQQIMGAHQKIRQKESEKQQQLSILEQLEKDLSQFKKEQQQKLFSHEKFSSHLENMVQIQKQEIMNLTQEKYKLSIKLDSLVPKNQSNLAQNLKNILKIDNQNELTLKVQELVNFKQKFHKFAECIGDLYEKCNQNQKNQEICYKLVWKWIKNVLEDYYLLKNQLQIKQGTHIVKKFVDNIQGVIKKGELRDKDIERQIDEMAEINII